MAKKAIVIDQNEKRHTITIPLNKTELNLMDNRKELLCPYTPCSVPVHHCKGPILEYFSVESPEKHTASCPYRADGVMSESSNVDPTGEQFDEENFLNSLSRPSSSKVSVKKPEKEDSDAHPTHRSTSSSYNSKFTRAIKSVKDLAAALLQGDICDMFHKRSIGSWIVDERTIPYFRKKDEVSCLDNAIMVIATLQYVSFRSKEHYIILKNTKSSNMRFVLKISDPALYTKLKKEWWDLKDAAADEYIVAIAGKWSYFPKSLVADDRFLQRCTLYGVDIYKEKAIYRLWK